MNRIILIEIVYPNNETYIIPFDRIREIYQDTLNNTTILTIDGPKYRVDVDANDIKTRLLNLVEGNGVISVAGKVGRINEALPR